MQSEQSITRQVNSALDDEINIYETLVEQFEKNITSREKGSLLNECDVQLQKLHSMISQETLLSRRKRINLLKTRFEKEQVQFLKIYDKEQVIDIAIQLSLILQNIQQAHSQAIWDAQVKDGQRNADKLEKICQSYDILNLETKLKKIFNDAITLSQQFNQQKLIQFEQRLDSVLIDADQKIVRVPSGNIGGTFEDPMEMERPLSYQIDPLNQSKHGRKKFMNFMNSSVMGTQPPPKGIKAMWSKTKSFFSAILSPCTHVDQDYQIDNLQHK